MSDNLQKASKKYKEDKELMAIRYLEWVI